MRRSLFVVGVILLGLLLAPPVVAGQKSRRQLQWLRRSPWG